MAYQTEDNFPDNPGPYPTVQSGPNSFTNQDLKNVNTTLDEILAAIQAPSPRTLDAIQEATLTNSGTTSIGAEFSTVSVVNPIENDNTIEVSVTTEGSGIVTITVSPGDTLTLPYVPGISYPIGDVLNNGSADGQLLGVRYI